jgi:hypothetical protein
VLFTSGYPLDSRHEHHPLPDDVPFVEKPFTGESLIGAVANLLGSGGGC